MQTVDQQPGRNRGERQVVGRRPGTHTHMSIVTCVTCKTTHDLMGLASLSFSCSPAPAAVPLDVLQTP